MRKLFAILACSLFLNMAMLITPATVYAQDDCPTGHVRHPAVSPLDHEYMVSAFKASFRGEFGREPSMIPGSGKDDGEYYISASNHYGVYGDDQCHAGWSGYWESWLRIGHGDIALVQTPARFLPGVIPPPPPAPQPPIPAPSLDLSKIQAQLDAIIANLAEHTRADGEAHTTINQNVSDGRAENRSFFAAVAAHWKSIVAFASPIITYETCHLSGKC